MISFYNYVAVTLKMKKFILSLSLFLIMIKR